MGMDFCHHHGRQCLLWLCIRDMATVSQCAETIAGKRDTAWLLTDIDKSGRNWLTSADPICSDDQAAPKASTVPPKVLSRLENLTKISPRLRSSPKPASKSTSFGVYLGSFDEFVTDSQTDILTRWGTVILDPLQRGVLNTLVTQPESMSQNIIGRVDLCKTLGNNFMSTEDLMVKGVDEIVDLVQGKFKLRGSNSNFTGVLLAGWEKRISAAVLNEIIRFLFSELVKAVKVPFGRHDNEPRHRVGKILMSVKKRCFSDNAAEGGLLSADDLTTQAGLEHKVDAAQSQTRASSGKASSATS